MSLQSCSSLGELWARQCRRHIRISSSWFVEVCYVNVEEQGRQNISLWDAIVDAFQSALLTIAGFHDNAVISDQLLNEATHVSVR